MPASSGVQNNASLNSIPQGNKDKGEKKQISINLSGKPKQSTSTVFYKWAIQAGRVIIILTELVALSALFYRFVIDRQIADINDQIDRQVLYIKNQEASEKEFRSIQNKLATIKTIKQDTDAKVEVMNKILNTANTGVFSTNNLNVNKNIISLNGVSSSIFPINNFVDELKSHPYITSISIDEITSTDTGVLFKLQITLVNLPEETETSQQQSTEEVL